MAEGWYFVRRAACLLRSALAWADPVVSKSNSAAQPPAQAAVQSKLQDHHLSTATITLATLYMHNAVLTLVLCGTGEKPFTHRLIC